VDMVTFQRNLGVQEASHGHSVESTIVINQVHLGPTADATHAHTADNVTLTQTHALSINEALHSHTADTTVWGCAIKTRVRSWQNAIGSMADRGAATAKVRSRDRAIGSIDDYHYAESEASNV